MNFSPVEKIYAIWEQVRGNLPAWYELSPAMREAIIRMWLAGEKHALDQVKP